jgi:hypothetical protein
VSHIAEKSFERLRDCDYCAHDRVGQIRLLASGLRIRLFRVRMFVPPRVAPRNDRLIVERVLTVEPLLVAAAFRGSAVVCSNSEAVTAVVALIVGVSSERSADYADTGCS